MKILTNIIIFSLIYVATDLYGIYHKVGEYYTDTHHRVVSIEKTDSLLFSLEYAGLLEIIDVSNPIKPQLISELQMKSFWGGIIGGVYGKNVYLCGNDSIYVINISDIYNPVKERTYGFGSVRKVILSGNILYIADDNGFYIYNTAPRYEGIIWSSEDKFTSIILTSDSLFYGLSDKIKTLNMKNIEDPDLISELSISSGGYGGLAIKDSIMYVASENFYSINVKDSTNPSILDSISDHSSSYISITGGKACTNHDGLTVIDISDPYHLNEIGIYDSPGENFKVIADGDMVYDCDGYYGIHVIDISDPGNDYILGSVKTWRPASDIEYKEGFLLTADGYGLNIIDVSDPSNPFSTGNFFHALGETATLSLRDNTLCLGYSYQEPDMRMIDVSDPENPVELYDFDYVGTDLSTMYSAQDRDFVYLNNIEEFKIYEKSDIGDPVLKGNYFAKSQITDIVVSNNVAYLNVTLESYDSECIDLVDISDPTNPTLISSIDSVTTGMWNYTELVIRNNILFASSDKFGLKIYDVNVSSAPKLIKTIFTHEYPILPRPFIYEGQLFLFDRRWNELFIYDIMDTDNIYLLQSIKLDRGLGEMIYINDLLYSTKSWNYSSDYGIFIMDISQFVSIEDSGNKVIQEYNLEQNYPNPFNPTTTINFSIPEDNSKIKIIVYNVSGQVVDTLFDGVKNSGKYSINYDAATYNSGVYYYSLEVDGVNRASKKMVMIK